MRAREVGVDIRARSRSSECVVSPSTRTLQRRVPLFLLCLLSLPSCWALKSLASESESKHKVRATIEAALHTFEVQLLSGECNTNDEDYALARALLERGKDIFTDFVVNQTFPRSGSACSWDWTSMQCEPCGQCRRAKVAELLKKVYAEKNESSWCMARAANERISGQSCAASALSATRDGMMVGLTSGMVGKRLNDALYKFVERELIAPTNSPCYFDFLHMRCEPSAMCNLEYQKGDITPAQACRLIPPESRAAVSAYDTDAPAACSWNSQQWRCEQGGACHPEVWRWVHRGLQRLFFVLRRLISLGTVALFTANAAACKSTLIQATAAGKRANAMLVRLAHQLRIREQIRTLVRTTRETLGKTLSSAKNRLSHTLVPKTTAAFKMGLAYAKESLKRVKIGLTHAKNSLSRPLRSLNLAKFKAAPVARHWGKAKADAEATLDDDEILEYDDEMLVFGRCDWTKVKAAVQAALYNASTHSQAALKTAALVLDSETVWQRILRLTMDSWNRWQRLLLLQYSKGLQAMEDVRLCPDDTETQGCSWRFVLREYVLQGGEHCEQMARAAAQKGASIIMRLHRFRVLYVSRWIVGALGASKRVVVVVREKYAELVSRIKQALKEIESELDSTPQLEKADFCGRIPEEKQARALTWQFYSPYSAEETTKRIHQRIISQTEVVFQ